MTQRAKRIESAAILANPHFWGVYYYDLGFHEELESFGVGDKEFQQVRDLFPAIPDPDFFASYVCRLPLAGGCEVSIEFEACEDDPGVAFCIQRPEWPEPLLLCRMPGALDMPPFRWEEVVRLVDAVSDRTQGQTLRRSALLLLFPGVWLTQHDDWESVRRQLRHAWSNSIAPLLPAGDEWIESVAEHQLVPESVPVLGPGNIVRSENRQWTRDERFGWINNSWSLRNPRHSSPEVLEKVRQFFDQLGESTTGQRV